MSRGGTLRSSCERALLDEGLVGGKELGVAYLAETFRCEHV